MIQWCKKWLTGAFKAQVAGLLDERLAPLHQRLERLEADTHEPLRHKINAALHGRLTALHHKLEARSHGSRATYIGGDRVLVKGVVDGRNLAFIVEADDNLFSPWLIITGAYDTDLTNYFLRELRPDSHCIDVGANFGYFTCLIARFAPQGRGGWGSSRTRRSLNWRATTSPSTA